MEVKAHIQYHGLDASPSLNARIEELADRLGRLHARISGCRITVELPNDKHRKGNLYRIRIEVDVPGGCQVVNRHTGQNPAHADPYIAVRDAFEAMERKLQSHNNRRRNEVKHHEPALEVARVTRVFPQDGYGFLSTVDGREIYFHENSVLNDAFADLEVGALVSFHEEMGDEGPQASTVHA